MELTRCESARFDSRRIQISAWAGSSEKKNKKNLNVYLEELLQV